MQGEGVNGQTTDEAPFLFKRWYTNLAAVVYLENLSGRGQNASWLSKMVENYRT